MLNKQWLNEWANDKGKTGNGKATEFARFDREGRQSLFRPCTAGTSCTSMMGVTECAPKAGSQTGQCTSRCLPHWAHNPGTQSPRNSIHKHILGTLLPGPLQTGGLKRTYEEPRQLQDYHDLNTDDCDCTSPSQSGWESCLEGVVWTVERRKWPSDRGQGREKSMGKTLEMTARSRNCGSWLHPTLGRRGKQRGPGEGQRRTVPVSPAAAEIGLHPGGNREPRRSPGLGLGAVNVP